MKSPSTRFHSPADDVENNAAGRRAAAAASLLVLPRQDGLSHARLISGPSRTPMPFARDDEPMPEASRQMMSAAAINLLGRPVNAVGRDRHL